MPGLILSTIHMLVHLINDFSKVTQLVSGGPGGFHTQTCCCRVHAFNHYSSL